MTPLDQPLVRVLAQADACFVPPRSWGDWDPPSRLAGAAWLARRRLADGLGLPYRSMARSGAERIAALRLLEQAAGSGQLVVARQSGSLWPNVALTPAGEEYARCRAILPSLREAFDLAARLKKRKPARSGGWHAECDLVRASAGRKLRLALFDLQLVALPGLRAGWLEANSDMHGRMHYRVARPPRRRPPWPTWPESTDEEDVAAFKLYEAAYMEARAALRVVDTRGELGPLPLSVTD